MDGKELRLQILLDFTRIYIELGETGGDNMNDWTKETIDLYKELMHNEQRSPLFAFDKDPKKTVWEWTMHPNKYLIDFYGPCIRSARASGLRWGDKFLELHNRLSTLSDMQSVFRPDWG